MSTRGVVPSPPFESNFLANLDQRSADIVLAAADLRRVAAKRRVLIAGQPGTQLFMLRSGRARYYMTPKAGDEIVLHILAPGDIFGLASLLRRPTAYIGNTDTISECEILAWGHTRIRELAVVYPQLAENALRIILHYLERYINRHVGLVSRTAEHRLSLALLDLGHRMGRVHPDGVEIDVTNEQLSHLADISHFTTSRLLNQWVRNGVVCKSRGRVVICTPEALVME